MLISRDYIALPLVGPYLIAKVSKNLLDKKFDKIK